MLSLRLEVSILKSIAEQKALTPELQKKIQQSFDLQELEDFYLPYKKKKKTKADSARENGLEPLAKIIMAQNNDDIDFISTQYINKNVVNEEEALQGARDIIAEWINENIYVRKQLRRLYQRKAIVSTKVIKTKKEEEAAQKFNQYFDWSENLSKAPSHRLLAMLRAEAEGFVKLNVTIEKEEAINFIEENTIKNKNSDANEDVIYFESMEYEKIIKKIENYFNEIYNEDFKIIGNRVNNLNNQKYYVLSNRDRTHKIKLQYILNESNSIYKIKILDTCHLYSI